MTLPERQRLILKEIVDRYIRRREPVSSRMILEDYGLSVSSATVRNDMNALEAHGYIEKPYSSSGRVPTKKGYRFFVDWLLDLGELTKEERMEIVETYAARWLDVGETIRQTAFVLGDITGYAAFAVPPKLEKAKLERVVLLRMGCRLAFLAVVSDLGIVEHGLVPLDTDLSDEEIAHTMRTINETLRGADLGEVRRLAYTDEDDEWYERPARQALLVLSRLLDRRMRNRIETDGLLNLVDDLQQMIPDRAMQEFARLSRAIQDRAGFVSALDAARGERTGVVVNVGDFPMDGLEEFSVISCGYRPHDGVLGVVAPLWMDYGKSLSAATYIAGRLESLLMTCRTDQEREDER
jgi:heat-inducible transcriptional repressor